MVARQWTMDNGQWTRNKKQRNNSKDNRTMVKNNGQWKRNKKQETRDKGQ